MFNRYMAWHLPPRWNRCSTRRVSSPINILIICAAERTDLGAIDGADGRV